MKSPEPRREDSLRGCILEIIQEELDGPLDADAKVNFQNHPEQLNHPLESGGLRNLLIGEYNTLPLANHIFLPGIISVFQVFHT